MNTLNSFFVLIIIALFNFNVYAQELEVIYHETTKYGQPGTEIIFEIEIVNNSTFEDTVFMVRTINNLPVGLGWSSSLCLGICAGSSVDSLATTGGIFPPPLQTGDTVTASVHVLTQNNIGTAYIQVQIGTFRNPSARTTIDYTATTDPSVDVEGEVILSAYELAQNYPNPFNPSTKIEYGVKEAGFVSLEVYNILGVKVATLINEYLPAGNYITDFVASDLASGVYIYRLSVNNFTQTRKMILEK